MTRRGIWKNNSAFLRAQERPATLILTLTSRLRITHARQVYNRDTETGSWNFVVPLRTIRMRKMCQSQQFVIWAWETGCRLLSHGRSKRRSKRLSKLLLLRPKLSPEKIKKPSGSRKCVFFFTRTWGWNMYIFIFIWIVNEMTFCKISDYAERAEKNLFTNPDFEGMTL